jgi:hypothetical protein
MSFKLGGPTILRYFEWKLILIKIPLNPPLIKGGKQGAMCD